MNNTVMKSKKLKFIDLFSGIGGFRLGMESIGAECVFSSEIDSHAIEMYKENFGEDSDRDITKVKTNIIPNFDILCAGFPCQAFSISGKQKGFEDITRGTLFFDICRILKEKKPKVFVLENVQNLEKHDKGNTLYVMINSLNQLGYAVSYKVLNAKNFGVPQNRERIVIVGNREGKIFDFSKLKENPTVSMLNFLDKEADFEYLNEDEYTLIDKKYIKKQKKSGLIFVGYRNKKIRTAGTREGTEHLSRVHKQPNRIYDSMGIHPTIASQEKSGRYWILIDNTVRKLTLNECYRFFGFPENFKKIGLKSKLYERIGNSLCVPMIKEIAKEVEKQFFLGESNMEKNMNVDEELESFYIKASSLKHEKELDLTELQLNLVKNIVEKEETSKGVYTVLLTSLVYKSLNPEQDVRRHQANMDRGYSGRTFDTKYITPFLKRKQLLAAMKESGWLTRSLEQPIPYDLNYTGKISGSKVKESFLKILYEIEERKQNPKNFILAMLYLSIKSKEAKSIQLINPVISETKVNIDKIIEYLHSHFYYKYKTRGASILPVVALYSLYECILTEIKRFENKELQELSSHNSSDRSSGNTGDIVVLDAENNLYEVVEIKFDRKPDLIMIQDIYKKISSTTVQRYYLLSTLEMDDEHKDSVNGLINEIKENQGCQIIVNGILPTIKYYLRLLENTDKFLEKYIENIEKNPEINYEHKLAWNSILKEEKN